MIKVGDLVEVEFDDVIEGVYCFMALVVEIKQDNSRDFMGSPNKYAYIVAPVDAQNLMLRRGGMPETVSIFEHEITRVISESR
jgi:hypothetical protein